MTSLLEFRQHDTRFVGEQHQDSPIAGVDVEYEIVFEFGVRNDRCFVEASLEQSDFVLDQLKTQNTPQYVCWGVETNTEETRLTSNEISVAIADDFDTTIPSTESSSSLRFAGVAQSTK